MKLHRVPGVSIIVLTVFVLFCMTSPAQEKKLSPEQLPSAVASAFHRAYPTAKIKGASSEVENGKTLYEVESLDGKTNRDLLYKEDGTCVELEETVPAKSLTAGVMGSLKKELPKGRIQKAERLTKGKVIQYELLVISGRDRHEVVFDPAGKIVKNTILQLKALKDKKDEKEE